MSKLKKNYYDEVTAKLWRKIGDTVMFTSGLVSASVMGLPLDETTKLWIIWGVGLFGIIGKGITNFFTESSSGETAEEATEE